MDIARSCSHHSRLQGSWRGPACGDRRAGKGKSVGYLSLERSRKVRHLTSFRVDGPLSEEQALSSSCILDPLHAANRMFCDRRRSERIFFSSSPFVPLFFSTLLGNVYPDISKNSLRFRCIAFLGVKRKHHCYLSSCESHADKERERERGRFVLSNIIDIPAPITLAYTSIRCDGILSVFPAL